MNGYTAGYKSQLLCFDFESCPDAFYIHCWIGRKEVDLIELGRDIVY